METKNEELEQDLVSFKSDGILHVVEEKQDKFSFKNKEECTLVESKSYSDR